MQKLSFVPAFMYIGLLSYGQKVDMAHSRSVSVTYRGRTELPINSLNHHESLAKSQHS